MTDQILAFRERLAQAVRDWAEELTLCSDSDVLTSLQKAAESLHDFDAQLEVTDWALYPIPAPSAP